MPLAKYFKAEGPKVMDKMQDRYGDDKGKNVFYATAKKNDMAPPAKRKTFGQKIGSKD